MAARHFREDDSGNGDKGIAADRTSADEKAPASGKRFATGGGAAEPATAPRPAAAPRRAAAAPGARAASPGARAAETGARPAAAQPAATPPATSRAAAQPAAASRPAAAPRAAAPDAQAADQGARPAAAAPAAASRSAADAAPAPARPAARSEQQAPPSARTRSLARGSQRVKAADFHGAAAEREPLSRTEDWRRSRTPILLRVLIGVAIVAAIAIASTILGPRLAGLLSTNEIEAGLEVRVFIAEGSSTRDIAQTLKSAGVIGDTGAFINACDRRGVSSSLKPGSYLLVTGMPLDELIDELVAGPPDGNIRLTIPEGLTIAQTAVRVEEACGIPRDEFIAEASNASKYVGEFPFLEGCYNNSLEGFLYPKTYSIPPGVDAAYVVRTLLTQFDIETAGVDWTSAAHNGYSPYEVLVIASMVEREAWQPAERGLVASVIVNRLGISMPLRIDATVVYALNDPYRDYAEQPLLYADLEVDSPYNTYKYNGLPPGPICSPHISSILAAATPDQTDYYYYVLTSTEGYHTFCRDYAEFEEAQKTYRQVFGLE